MRGATIQCCGEQKGSEDEIDSASEDLFDRVHTVDILDLLNEKTGTEPSDRSTSSSNQEDSHEGNTAFSISRHSERGRFRWHGCGGRDDSPGRDGLCTYSRQEIIQLRLKSPMLFSGEPISLRMILAKIPEFHGLDPNPEEFRESEI